MNRLHLIGLASLLATAVAESQGTRGRGSVAAGSWKVSESKSEMTDDRSVTLELRAAASIRVSYQTVIPTLVIRCAEKELNAYVDFDLVLGDGDVRLRWDQDPPIEEGWARSTDYQAVFAPDPAALLVQLTKASLFRVEAHPYDRAPVTARFNPTGIGRYTARIYKACPNALSAPDFKPGPDGPFLDFQVQVQAVPDATNPAPKYPNALRAANISGEVTVQFVVDTTGRVEPASIEVTKSAHPMFTQAVREVLLAEHRFTPATIGTRKVKQFVERTFSFSLR